MNACAMLGCLIQLSPSLPTPLQSDGGSVLPAFLAQRPQVMQEVQLGPLVGSGSAGRCYRAQWQGGRVAVKIVECSCEGATPSGSGGLSPATSGHLDSGAGSAKPAAEAALLEALLSRSLAHPHIVTTYAHAVSTKQVGAGVSRGCWFSTPELMDSVAPYIPSDLSDPRPFPPLTRFSRPAALHPAQCLGSCEWRQAVWIVQEYCSRGSLKEAVDKGWLSLPEGGPNLPAVLTSAMEIAGGAAPAAGVC